MTRPRDPLPLMLMRVVRIGLVPASEYDEERFAALRQGEIVHIAVAEPPPNEPFRRRFHAALSKLAEGIGEDREQLRRRLKIACKFIDGVAKDGGDWRVLPVSETTMSDSEFTFYANTIGAHASEKYQVDFWSLGKHADA